MNFRPFSVLFINVVLVLAVGSTVQSLVEFLPGYPKKLPFKLETGYVGIRSGELGDDDLQLFYYFIESEANPKTDPLLLWLAGGPGCSGFSPLVYEIGPLAFDYTTYNEDLPSLLLNQYSWTKVANIIFLDAPVGTGFSYSISGQGYSNNINDAISAAQIYDFLRKWLTEHPKFMRNPVYIGGDDYSGMVVPLLVQNILNGKQLKQVKQDPRINLKGYLLGNPSTDEFEDANSVIPFSHRMSLISDEIYESVKESCKGDYVNVDSSNTKCKLDLQIVDKCIKKILGEHVLEPNCNALSSIRGKLMRMRPSDFLLTRLNTPSSSDKFCREYNHLLADVWANDESVQTALHVREGTKKEWSRCNTSLDYTFDLPSTLNHHRNLTQKNLRALIYSGDHDMVTPYLGTRAWIKSLNLTNINDWEPWLVDGQVAGYMEEYASKHSKFRLTFATLKGGGHTAPESMPKECLAMVDRWFAYYPL